MYVYQKLEIKAFDGDLNDWQNFYEGFCCSVDSNPNIPTVQKITYLKNLLTSNPAATISRCSTL